MHEEEPEGLLQTYPGSGAIQNGLQVHRVELRLVDDDLPVLAPASEWYELRDQYVNGQGQHNLTLAANDAGSGIERIAFEESCVGEVVAVDAPCDPTHNTPELSNRICPASFSAEITVDATKLSEGKHIFRETASDLAGNIGVSDSWTVFVDRTGPSTPANFELSYFDPADEEATVSWDHPLDPTLGDGSPGSGTAYSEVRYRLNGGSFSNWQEAPDDQIDIDGAKEGDTVTVEARAIDGVGNISAVGSGTLTLHPLLEDPLLAETAAEWFAGEYGVDLATAHVWMAVQDKAVGLSEDVASAANPGFAGVWFDNTARRIKVGLKSGTPHGPVQDVLLARGLASETDIVTTLYSEQELEGAHPAIDDALSELFDQGLVATSEGAATNSIHIYVAPTATSEQRAIIAQVASNAPVNVTIEDSPLPSLSVESVSCKFPNCSRPLRGGVFIESRDRRSACTAGFLARSIVDNEPYLLTAGHCFVDVPRDMEWRAFSMLFGIIPVPEIIGRVHNYFLDENTDAGIIRIRDGSYWRESIRPIVFVNKSDSTKRRPAYRIRRVQNNGESRRICATGSVSGKTRCGVVIKRKLKKTIEGIRFKQLGLACMPGLELGDSGGPMFAHHTAYGLVTAIVPGSCLVFYQSARGAEERLKIEIVTRK